MYERFTEPARQVVILAQEEARALRHAYIGTEHLLLGLLRLQDGGLAGRVLGTLGIGIEHVRGEVVKIAGAGLEAIPASGLPFTPRSKKVLELALREALALEHNVIGTEHLLLGIAREKGGVAARVLLHAGAGPEAIRAEILRALGDLHRVADVPGQPASGRTLDRRIESLAIRERLTAERLQRLREELAELRAEPGRLDAPGEETRAAATDDLSGQVALVTGGGRGIGAGIARELADAGMRVAVAARTPEQVQRVAGEIGGLALEVDVSDAASVARMVQETERELGPIDLLVNNAGGGLSPDSPPIWEGGDAAAWWRVFEINMLGAYLCCCAVLPGMVARGGGRIVNVGSGGAYLPVTAGRAGSTAYGPSKAALGRFGEILAGQLQPHGVAVFTISPGLVRTELTDQLGDDAPWTPPQLAPRLVRALASGRADRLAGRYIHAEHDDSEDLIARADEIVAQDLNAIRLRR